MKLRIRAYHKVFNWYLVLIRLLMESGCHQISIALYAGWRRITGTDLRTPDRYERHRAVYGLVTARQFHLCSPEISQYFVVSPEQQIEVSGPRFFGEAPQTAHVKQPEIYYALLNNVTLVGGSNVIICDDETAILEDIALKNFERCDFRFNLTPIVTREKVLLDACCSTRQGTEFAISLCGKGSGNLYHWLFEFVSRLKLLEFAGPEYVQYPILVDERIRDIPQLMEILNTCASGRRHIFLKHGEQVQVGRLLSLSKLIWAPFMLRPKEQFKVEDFIISPLAIDYIRANFATAPSHVQHERIFISRANYSDRRRTNETEVFGTLEPMGFVRVCPEKHSFKDQASIFAGASMVVGVTGAALSNLVFCRPGTLAICLVSSKAQMGYFTNIAKAVGVDLVFLAANGDQSFGNLHQPFNVDIGQLKVMLETMISQRSEQSSAVGHF